MLKALLLAFAGFLFCQTASATTYFITVSVSRPNTPWLVFFDDRNNCMGEAAHMRWSTAMNGGFMGPGAIAHPVYNAREFSDCMVAKGYRLDSNGYRAIWLRLRSDGRYWMGAL